MILLWTLPGEDHAPAPHSWDQDGARARSQAQAVV